MWKFWRRKARQLPSSDSSWLMIQVHPDANVTIYLDWPEPKSELDARRIGHHLAGLIHLIHTGQITGNIRHAVIEEGKGDDGLRGYVSQIVTDAYELISTGGKLVVPPEEAFKET